MFQLDGRRREVKESLPKHPKHLKILVTQLRSELYYAKQEKKKHKRNWQECYDNLEERNQDLDHEYKISKKYKRAYYQEKATAEEINKLYMLEVEEVKKLKSEHHQTEMAH